MTTTNQQRIERLTDLRKRVERAPLTEFRMDRYGSKSACRTCACVAGLACLSPKFKKAGGKATWRKADADERRIYPSVMFWLEAKYGRATYPGWAAGEYLGIDESDWERLFHVWDHKASAAELRAAKVAEIEALIAATPGSAS